MTMKFVVEGVCPKGMLKCEGLQFGLDPWVQMPTNPPNASLVVGV